ncbi:MAG: S9 family peptidase [Gammaproteobacteria bacterium]|nr:S9 family peptidase [Gammaproteobacteria bacterium]
MVNSIRVLVATSLLCALTSSFAAKEPLPVDAWLKTDIVGASLSHDGTYLGVLREDQDREGHRIVWVYTFDEKGTLVLHRRINSENMRIGGFTWLSDTQFIMGLRQQVRNRIDGFNQGVYKGRSQIVDLAKDEFVPLPIENPGIEHLLPKQPTKIIVSEDQGGSRGGRRQIGGGSFWHSYYEFDLSTMRKKLLLKAKYALQSVRFDIDGNPEFAIGFDLDSLEQVYKYRPERDNPTWVEFGRSHIDSFESFVPVGTDPTAPHREYVVAHNGEDKRALWSYDKQKRAFSERVYGRTDVDVLGTINHSNSLMHYGDVVAVTTLKERVEYEYFPEYEVERAIHAQFANLIDNPFSPRVVSVSRDGQSMVVRNSGPKSAPSFYLFRQGQFNFLGTIAPDVSSDDLSETTYIEYPSRDGLTIPGYITTPVHSEPPYPLVVMPHGGPFVTEGIGFDPWAQLLANNGYMVLQPQYRGSHNYGLDFYKSAFIEKSEAGYGMQDDKDDGALYLVEQGLVDPDRMAMFGWSYGGYAALVASMRTPQIYQCAVAGAAVSDPIMQVNYYRYSIPGAAKVEQLNTWTDAFSPFREVANINVPLFIIHGDNDQRVPVDHSRKLIKRLKDLGIEHKYLEIKGIDHFSNTMERSHLKQFYSALLEYLATDCGPEGL